jgi:hypothetical protein
MTKLRRTLVGMAALAAPALFLALATAGNKLP